ncbi:hypothetical protein EYZ11_007916 [Aspergillus tanneri]|uniref:Uncharacterized protein n=1 Tax=Aspergillus tanneri TaxID=1220188 RepID=A0A4S3JBS2_9EURO|nr:hypothetical protein EYZ11_007916 [Aspergillus tanneri]
MASAGTGKLIDSPVGCGSQSDDAMPEDDSSSVAPAQLSYLTIYNPLLGPTDETIQDQIVFYTSRLGEPQRHKNSEAGPNDNGSNYEHNEKLRQIGLVQGMVSFARWGPPLDEELRNCAKQLFQEFLGG